MIAVKKNVRDWTSTPNELRRRKCLNLTIDAEAIDMLDTLAGPGKRSALVELLIREEFDRKIERKKRG